MFSILLSITEIGDASCLSVNICYVKPIYLLLPLIKLSWTKPVLMLICSCSVAVNHLQSGHPCKWIQLVIGWIICNLCNVIHSRNRRLRCSIMAQPSPAQPLPQSQAHVVVSVEHSARTQSADVEFSQPLYWYNQTCLWPCTWGYLGAVLVIQYCVKPLVVTRGYLSLCTGFVLANLCPIKMQMGYMRWTELICGAYFAALSGCSCSSSSSSRLLLATMQLARAVPAVLAFLRTIVPLGLATLINGLLNIVFPSVYQSRKRSMKENRAQRLDETKAGDRTSLSLFNFQSTNEVPCNTWFHLNHSDRKYAKIMTDLTMDLYTLSHFKVSSDTDILLMVIQLSEWKLRGSES